MKILSLVLTLFAFELYAKSACDADAKKYCQGVDPGKGQRAKCLSDYEGSLSAACSKELKDFNKKALAKNPCFNDLAEYCSEVPSVAHKLDVCLLKNETRLSSVCAKDFAKKKGKILTKNPCAQDMIKNCYSQVANENGALNLCMIRNRTKLTGFCKKQIDESVARIKKSNPCFDETEKYCPTLTKFADIQDCLAKKASTLSPLCKKVVQNEIDKEKANPCYKDLTRHCIPNITPAQQHECLSINEEHLSNACRQFRVQESKKVDRMITACEKDRLKFCPKAPQANGMVIKCLRENKAKLSKSCSSLM